MTPELWIRIRGVLESVAEVSEPEVTAYLDARCDPEIRSEVESLLAASRVQNSFLDHPAIGPEIGIPAGTRIGPYIVESAAGYGGMGVVYRARDERLRRTVAIKLIPVSVHQADLLDEARAASSLNHPNIVIVHDVLEYRGVTAMVMEFVEGRTLADLLAKQPLDAKSAISYARQIAAALAVSHEAGIVHRDLKPSNVIVRADGVIRVLDFGIAEPVANRGERLIMGTRGYTSPEQAAGKAVDARTDIYSFGVLLREMLGPAAPTRWRPMIERCVQPRPEDRFESMRQVIAELDHKPALLRIAAAIVVLLPAASLIWYSRAPAAPPVSGPQDMRRVASFEQEVLFPAISPDGKQIVYSVDGKLRVQGIKDSEGRDWNLDGRHPAFSPDGKMLAFRSERAGGGIFVADLRDHSPDPGTIRKVASGFHPAWSPDGRAIAFSSDEFLHVERRPTAFSRLFVVDVASGHVRSLIDPALLKDAIQPTWSPRGDRIAFWSVDSGGARALWTVPASGGAPARLTDGKSLDWNPVWSPQGELYWASSRGGSMAIWRVAVNSATGQAMGEPKQLPLPTSYAGFLGISHSGQLVYVSLQAASSIWRASLAGIESLVRLTPRAMRITQPTVSPDGEWIAGCGQQGAFENIVIFRRDGSGLTSITAGDYHDRGPAWSPDGTTIAFGSNRSGAYQLWGVRRDGTGLRQLTNGSGGAFSAVWAPDGQRFAWFARGYVPTISSASGFAAETTMQLSPPPAKAGFRPSSWSPDGKEIAGILRSRDGGRIRPAIYSLSGRTYRLLDASCDALMWLPGVRRILCSDGRKLLSVPADGGVPEPVLELPHPIENQFAVSADGRHAYLTMSENLSELWFASLR